MPKAYWIPFAIVLLIVSVGARATDVFHCDVHDVNGRQVKLATVTRDGKTYALNGQARERADSKGWVDGKTFFDAPEMLRLMQIALSMCDSGGPSMSSAAPAAPSLVKPSKAGIFAGAAFDAKSLVAAANAGDTGFIQRYIASGHNVNASIVRDGERSTAVDAAAASGHCEQLDMLLNAGGVADPRDRKIGFTPLSYAATAGATACVVSLLRRHVRLDVRTAPGGDTSLIIAAYRGHLDIVRALVDAGASLSLSNNDGDTAYRAAQYSGGPTVSQYLWARGAR